MYIAALKPTGTFNQQRRLTHVVPLVGGMVDRHVKEGRRLDSGGGPHNKIGGFPLANI